MGEIRIRSPAPSAASAPLRFLSNSPYPDDWRELNAPVHGSPNRGFIKENYAQTDPANAAARPCTPGGLELLSKELDHAERLYSSRQRQTGLRAIEKRRFNVRIPAVTTRLEPGYDKPILR